MNYFSSVKIEDGGDLTYAIAEGLNGNYGTVFDIHEYSNHMDVDPEYLIYIHEFPTRKMFGWYVGDDFFNSKRLRRFFSKLTGRNIVEII